MTRAIFRSAHPSSPATAVDRCLMQVVTSLEIVTAKLDAALVARFTGDIPQNVNFALKAEVARTFLLVRHPNRLHKWRARYSRVGEGHARRPRLRRCVRCLEARCGTPIARKGLRGFPYPADQRPVRASPAIHWSHNVDFRPHLEAPVFSGRY
jgi:hypothetical protein